MVSGQPRSRERSVLCVDDDASMRNALRRLLTEAGLDVRLAAGGAEALAEAQRRPPDLILMDVRMPEMDGYETCSVLQELPGLANIPVIFVTGLDEERDKARALKVGASDYIVKPFCEDELLQTVLRLVEPEPQARTGDGTERLRQRDFRRFKTRLLELLPHDDELATQLAALHPSDLYVFGDSCNIPGDLLASWIADFFGVPLVTEIDAQSIVLGELPAQFCRSNEVIVVEGPAFVLSNPFDWEVMDMLRIHAGTAELAMRIAPPETLGRLFRGEEVVVSAPEAPVKPAAPARPRESLAISSHAAPLDISAGALSANVGLVNRVISQAIQKRASDIHIEPGEHEVGLRYRIDGMLIPEPSLPREAQAALLSRVKIMARLDIAERRVPQDGRVPVQYNGRRVDLRVSTLPTRHGEKIVVRVLDQSATSLDLTKLGFEPEPLQGLQASVERPHGILLVTGPTGSGKTTTLYSALKALNRPHRNIVTVEDPIEFELARVNQVQVHPAAGLTFAAALRSILRQDPDIIMVGEIRDSETLDIAMKAALTGHLVLSTLHTNDAVSTISRLLDMGAEPFLVASTLHMVSGQRLLRRLCPHCKVPAPAPAAIADTDGLDLSGLRGPKGCARCNESGYFGRMAVAEVLVVDESWRGLIATGADLTVLRAHAREIGIATMRINALRKAARGLTSIEEVLRVTG